MPYYLYPKVGSGRAAIAVEVEDGWATVGVAFCSPKDQFRRDKGRMIATNRLKFGDGAKFFMKVKADPNWKRQQLNEVIINWVLEGNQLDPVPSWVRHSGMS